MKKTIASNKLIPSMNKILRAIRGCKTHDQLDVCQNMIQQFSVVFGEKGAPIKEELQEYLDKKKKNIVHL